MRFGAIGHCKPREQYNMTHGARTQQQNQLLLLLGSDDFASMNLHDVFLLQATCCALARASRKDKQHN